MPALRIAVLTAAVLASSLAAAQTTYRWIDKASGRTVYSDPPPPPDAKRVVESSGKAPDDEPQWPYATRQAMQKFPVTLYTLANCIDQCRQARDFLNARGVPFTEKLMTRQEEIDALAEKLGASAAVPSLFVGQQSFRGFAPESWNNLLDLAGHPKSAPYGAKPSGAFAQ